MSASATSTPAEAARRTRPALSVDRIDAYYGKSQVLSQVSLEVSAGEIVVLLGRNGAGKTTTLRTIAGVHPAAAGRVSLDGVGVTRMRAFRRVRAGMVLVPSGARAFGDLTVEENLELVRGRHNGAGEHWTRDRVYELFPKLKTLRSSASGSLSGGERQMLAVGRALMASPLVMILDEPSEGLAPVVVQAIGTLLRELRESTIAVLLAEQNHHLALGVADRAYFIEKGRVALDCSAEEARSPEILTRYLGV